MNKIDVALQQKRAAEGDHNQSGLSSTPYYIQKLESQIYILEYKLNLVLAKLHIADPKPQKTDKL
jgi:hypothetical protein